MILYYTAGQKTKIFAEALAEVTGRPCYRLSSKLEKKTHFKFMIHALYLALTGKAYPVDNMPEKIESEEIFLCVPIWGGMVTGPAWYFLNHADLKGRKVNFLLTSASNNDRYRVKAKELLQLIDCVHGEVYSFAAEKNPDKLLIVEQLREMLPDELVRNGL